LNGAMLSVSDKSYSVNEHTQETSELMKLHIQGVWQNAYKFIRQLAHDKYNERTTKKFLSIKTFMITHRQTLSHLLFRLRTQSVI